MSRLLLLFDLLGFVFRYRGQVRGREADRLSIQFCHLPELDGLTENILAPLQHAYESVCVFRRMVNKSSCINIRGERIQHKYTHTHLFPSTEIVGVLHNNLVSRAHQVGAAYESHHVGCRGTSYAHKKIQT
jgi:hypothetical protein